LINDLTDGRMVFAQQSHHVLRVGAFRKAGESAQVAEKSRDLTPVALQLLLCSRRDNQVGYLGRKESPQLTHALDFINLIGDPLLQVLI
jgi:hypothetical protein